MKTISHYTCSRAPTWQQRSRWLNSELPSTEIQAHKKAERETDTEKWNEKRKIRSNIGSSDLSQTNSAMQPSDDDRTTNFSSNLLTNNDVGMLCAHCVHIHASFVAEHRVCVCVCVCGRPKLNGDRSPTRNINSRTQWRQKKRKIPKHRTPLRNAK